VLKSRGKHVILFIQTLNLISEQQEAVCCRRDFTEVCIILLPSSWKNAEHCAIYRFVF